MLCISGLLCAGRQERDRLEPAEAAAASAAEQATGQPAGRPVEAKEIESGADRGAGMVVAGESLP